MCGIAGIVRKTQSSEGLEAPLRSMQAALSHRGPDDRGLFVSDDGRCGLAHTRLSILDLSPAGHQPMGISEHGAKGKERSAKSEGHTADSREQGARSS